MELICYHLHISLKYVMLKDLTLILKWALIPHDPAAKENVYIYTTLLKYAAHRGFQIIVFEENPLCI